MAEDYKREWTTEWPVKHAFTLRDHNPLTPGRMTRMGWMTEAVVTDMLRRVGLMEKDGRSNTLYSFVRKGLLESAATNRKWSNGYYRPAGALKDIVDAHGWDPVVFDALRRLGGLELGEDGK